MHEHTLPSEPSVMVAKGAVVSKGFSDRDATEYCQQFLRSDTVALEIASLP